MEVQERNQQVPMPPGCREALGSGRAQAWTGRKDPEAAEPWWPPDSELSLESQQLEHLGMVRWMFQDSCSGSSHRRLEDPGSREASVLGLPRAGATPGNKERRLIQG